MSPEDVVDHLIARRKSEGLSQQEVASRMGVGQSTVSEFESKKHTPRLSTLVRYANAVDLSISIDVLEKE